VYFKKTVNNNQKSLWFAVNRHEVSSHGAYITSFAQGLDDVLQDYRQALLDIESSLLADPHLTAVYVQTRLEQVKNCDATASDFYRYLNCELPLLLAFSFWFYCSSDFK